MGLLVNLDVSVRSLGPGGEVLRFPNVAAFVRTRPTCTDGAGAVGLVQT